MLNKKFINDLNYLYKRGIDMNKMEGKEDISKEHAEVKHEHLKEHKEHSGKDTKSSTKSNLMIWFIVFAAVLILFNQWQLAQVSAVAYSGSSSSAKSAYKTTKAQSFSDNTDLSSIDVAQIQSTAQAINSLFPLDKIKTTEDAIAVMIPTGTPEYSEALGGITFDDPVASMTYLAKWYYSLSKEVKEKDPEIWQRYLKLAATPRGISCEFCCGVGAQGITADGKLRCGCKHMPALHAITIGLMKYTDMSDVGILKEIMKWKSVWFPKNMVGLAMELAGGDTSALETIPGMVGGC